MFGDGELWGGGMEMHVGGRVWRVTRGKRIGILARVSLE